MKALALQTPRPRKKTLIPSVAYALLAIWYVLGREGAVDLMPAGWG